MSTDGTGIEFFEFARELWEHVSDIVAKEWEDEQPDG